MFRKLSIALFGVLIWPVSTMAQDTQSRTSPFYIAGAVGQSTFWDVELDGGGDLEFDLLAFFISGAVGYRVSPNLRAEAEWLFESADIDDSSAEIEVIRGTISGYYDLAQTSMMGFSNITPYVGGGAGLANVEVVDDENELTFHAEAGLSMPITSNIDFVPGVRFEYIFLDDDDADDDLWITQLRAGIRYSF
ncbi:MAG: porin family protein [Alphaproteobacteria bacterium]|nr:porin family protein [Alphaproteobacteria bacterium]